MTPTSEGPDTATFLAPGLEPAAMAAFFRAAARLYFAKPWDLAEEDDLVFSVTIPSLDVKDAVVAAVGATAKNFGLSVFRDAAAFHAWEAAIEARHGGAVAKYPLTLSVDFGAGKDLAPALHREVAKHGWTVVDGSIPWIEVVEGAESRPPTPQQLATAEATCIALADVVADKASLLRAWDIRFPFSRTFTVDTHQGATEITIRAPHEGVAPRPYADLETGALLDGLRKADASGRDLARPGPHQDLEAELLCRFVTSLGADAPMDLGPARMTMDFGRLSLGKTIATIDSADLADLLFEVIPPEFAIDGKEAESIVEQLRLLYTFLERDLALPQATACRAILDDAAAAKIESKGPDHDPEMAAMMKEMMRAAMAAGIDTSTPEGLAKWMEHLETLPLPVSSSASAPTRLDPAASKKKKDKRKAERKARKKNR
jgi:hypothetical protein